MEENLIKAVEEKIENLENTKVERIQQIKREQKIDIAHIRLNEQKEQALEEIKNGGAESKEASVDLGKIDVELEKLKIAEENIVENVEKEITTMKDNLTVINETMAKKENAQKEVEKAEKDIKKLNQYKEEALEEIRSHGDGSKEASVDLGKIEAELANKNIIKENYEKIIEQSNEKINEFMQRSDIKIALEEKMNRDWEEAIKENEEFDKMHSQQGKDGQENGQNQERQNGKDDKQEKSQNKGQKNSNEEKNQSQQSQINNIVLDVSENKIKVNGNENLFYKEEFKNKKDIIQKYSIGSMFLNDKKAKKNIDYALISTLERIDDENGSLVEAYLKVIRGGEFRTEEVQECIEKLNNAVKIEYKFNKENGTLTNFREKRLARNASKLGIASLDGISEKGFFDKVKDMFSKSKNIKLFKPKEKIKALGSGATKALEEQKEKISNFAYDVKEKVEIKSRLKVENKDNKIEKAAQEAQKETQEEMGKEVQEIRQQEEEQK